MTLWEALFLAVVQGASEFLPISSSGHTALAAKLVGVDLGDHLPFVVIIHFGTLLAVIAYYRRELWEILRGCLRPGPEGRTPRHWLALLLVGTIPAAVVGLFAEEHVAAAFNSLLYVGVFWLVTAALMFSADRLRGRKRVEQMGLGDALWVGVAQALAIFPGVSRSGATIFGGLARGLDESLAPKFAFLLSVPIILGGSVKEAADLARGSLAPEELIIYGWACLVSAVVGYLSIRLVLGAVRAARLKYFALWCIMMSVVAFGWHFAAA